MKATFRPLGWTGPSTPADQRSSRWTFKASWQSTLDLLERELGYLDAADLVIEADFMERDIRLDGMPRGNARQPVHPGVRIAFDSKHGPLIYATDSCAFWQHNVRSIALGLEALRAVDRYGVTKRGEQYTGWKQLGSGIAVPAGQTVFPSPEAAARWLMETYRAAGGQEYGPVAWPLLITVQDVRRTVYRKVARTHHPDSGGTREQWNRLDTAIRLLGGA